MSEPISNFRLICDDCGPKGNNPEFLSKNPEEFIGCYVKVAFNTSDPPEDLAEDLNWPSKEHAWVMVTDLGSDRGFDDELVGVIDNYLRFVEGFEYGDFVAFDRGEIEELMVPVAK